MLWFEPGQLLIFLVAASILAVTPGPGVTYVLARTVAGGRGEGVASSFGTAVGGLVHVVAAALGLSAILASSAIAFSLVKYIGACYLVYLGIRMLLSAGGSARAALLPRAGARRAFLEGIVTEALNVKTALFFLAFIPQFVSPIAPAMGQFVVLGLVCVLLNTSVDVIVAVGASRLLASGGGRRFRHGDGSRWALDARSLASAPMWRCPQASADQVIVFLPTAGRTGLRSLLASVGLHGPTSDQ